MGRFQYVRPLRKSGIRANLPKDLFEFAKVGMQGGHSEYNLKDMGMYSNSYAEIALGHSRKIMDKLTVGAKVKFLLGIYNADFHINDMKLVMSDDKWLVSGDGEFSTAGIVDIPTKLKTKDVTDDYGNIHQETEEESRLRQHRNRRCYRRLRHGFRLRCDLPVTRGFGAFHGCARFRMDKLQECRTIGYGYGAVEFDGFHDIPFDSDKAAPGMSIEDQIDNLTDDLEDLFQMKVQGKDKHTKALGATLNIGALYTFPFYDKLKFGFWNPPVSTVSILGRKAVSRPT